MNKKHGAMMLKNCAIFLLVTLGLILSASLSHAAELQKIAVLELRNDESVSVSAARYLTDIVRGQASRSLPSSRFTIMTRENIIDMLPPGTDLAKCTTSTCEVEVGRKIGADYIVTGDILTFAGELRVVLKAHESATGAFLGEQTVKGKELLALEGSIREAAASLFALVKNHAGGGGGPEPPGPDVEVEVLRFESDPRGALVMSGGETLCTTPCSKALPLGPHPISMAKDRYFTKEEQITVKRDMKPLSFKLDPRVGSLYILARDVRGNDVRAKVLVDGAYVGRAPGTSKAIIGAHRVRVESEYGYWEGTVTIEESKLVQKTVTVAGEGWIRAQEENKQKRKKIRAWKWAATGVAGAGFVTGGIYYYQATDYEDKFDNADNEDDAKAASDSGAGAETLAWTGFSIGAVSGVAAGVLWIMDREPSPTAWYHNTDIVFTHNPDQSAAAAVMFRW
jgi:PEGA domain